MFDNSCLRRGAEWAKSQNHFIVRDGLRDGLRVCVNPEKMVHIPSVSACGDLVSRALSYN